MKTHIVSVLVGLWLGLLCLTASADLQEGVRLKAGGEVVEVDMGYLVPCVTDWNGDGKKDLIVGQFSDGKIRLYLNRGRDSAPVFKDFRYLRAGGEEISLPRG